MPKEQPQNDKPEETRRIRFLFGRDVGAKGIAKAIIDLVNEGRAKQGLPPLPRRAPRSDAK